MNTGHIEEFLILSQGADSDAVRKVLLIGRIDAGAFLMEQQALLSEIAAGPVQGTHFPLIFAEFLCGEHHQMVAVTYAVQIQDQLIIGGTLVLLAVGGRSDNTGFFQIKQHKTDFRYCFS